MRNLLLCALICANIFAAKPEREWTFLVYLNGNNDLDEYGEINLNQMESVGSSKAINVVVQWASGKSTTTKRMLVVKDRNTKKVTSPVVDEFPRVDMGAPGTLVDFAKWAISEYPAKHYFLVVWNHGSGWHVDSSVIKPWHISYDEFSKRAISTVELGQSMKEIASFLGRKLDIYASDACLMGMVEIASEMSDSVEYFLGSEDNEPGDGWPYHKLLARWDANPEIDPAGLAQILTEEYIRSVKSVPEGGEATFSGFNLALQGELEKEFAAFSRALRERMNESSALQQDVKKALKETVAFDVRDYKDLGDFLSQLRSHPEAGSLAQPLGKVLDSYIIANGTTSAFARAKGAAAWMPSEPEVLAQHMKDYRLLKFSQNTQWELVLETLHRK